MRTATAEQFEAIGQQREAVLMGIWIFLATEILLFGAVFTGFYIYRIQFAPVFAEAATDLGLLLGSVNTAILLTSGLTMALTERAAFAERRRACLLLLAITIVLGVVFLGIKFYEWYKEYTHHLMPVLGLPFEYSGEHPRKAELFFNFYYLLTGLHAIHMTIGAGLLAVLLWLVARWRESGRVARQVQVMGLYWAFVDVVWVCIFTSLYLLRA